MVEKGREREREKNDQRRRSARKFVVHAKCFIICHRQMLKSVGSKSEAGNDLGGDGHH